MYVPDLTAPEQEFGKRRPRATGTTLETAGQLVSRPAELPPVRSAFASTASERLETVGVGLQVPGKKFAPRRQQALRALPRPFISMAYCSAFIMNCMAMTLAVFYGSSFQEHTSVAWAIATTTSILFEYVLVQPVWIMVTAFIQVRLHLMKTVEDELAGNRVHHHDEADQLPPEPDAAPSQVQADDKIEFDPLDAILQGEEIDTVELPVFDLIPGSIDDILANRIENFVAGLLAPSATSTYNFVRDVSEVEFRRACGTCGLDPNDERVTALWSELDLDERGRAQVRDLLEALALSALDKQIATFFLRLDVVDERVRAEEVQRVLGGYMEDSKVNELIDGTDRFTFGGLRAKFNALIDTQLADQSLNMEIEEDRDDLARMLETQLSTALSRMDVRGGRRQVLLPRQRPYVVQNVEEVDEIELEPGTLGQ